MSRSQEVAEASARRMAIVDELLNLLTSDAISTKELQRLRFVAEIFGITKVVAELCSSASTREGRSELALAPASNIGLNISSAKVARGKVSRIQQKVTPFQLSLGCWVSEAEAAPLRGSSYSALKQLCMKAIAL